MLTHTTPPAGSKTGMVQVPFSASTAGENVDLLELFAEILAFPYEFGNAAVCIPDRVPLKDMWIGQSLLSQHRLNTAVFAEGANAQFDVPLVEFLRIHAPSLHVLSITLS